MTDRQTPEQLASRIIDDCLVYYDEWTEIDRGRLRKVIITVLTEKDDEIAKLHDICSKMREK